MAARAGMQAAGTPVHATVTEAAWRLSVTVSVLMFIVGSDPFMVFVLVFLVVRVLLYHRFGTLRKLVLLVVV